MKRLQDIVHENLCAAMSEALQATSGKYEKMPLFKATCDVVNEFTDQLKVKLATHLEDLYILERDYPMTISKTAAERNEEEARDRIKTRRHEVRLATFINHEELKTGKFTYEKQRTDKLLKEKDRALGPDPFQREIDVMIIVKGYYMTAAGRWVDNVCHAVRKEILAPPQKDFTKMLITKLGVTGPQGRHCINAFESQMMTNIRQVMQNASR
jgi:hypothetical protein